MQLFLTLDFPTVMYGITLNLSTLQLCLWNFFLPIRIYSKQCGIKQRTFFSHGDQPNVGQLRHHIYKRNENGLYDFQSICG